MKFYYIDEKIIESEEEVVRICKKFLYLNTYGVSGKLKIKTPVLRSMLKKRGLDSKGINKTLLKRFEDYLDTLDTLQKLEEDSNNYGDFRGSVCYEGCTPTMCYEIEVNDDKKTVKEWFEGY